jgi:hypothetical protein
MFWRRLSLRLAWSRASAPQTRRAVAAPASTVVRTVVAAPTAASSSCGPRRAWWWRRASAPAVSFGGLAAAGLSELSLEQYGMKLGQPDWPGRSDKAAQAYWPNYKGQGLRCAVPALFNSGSVSPTTPVAAVPMTTAPAPVATMPVTVMPTHLLGLEVIDFVAGGDGGMRIRAGRSPRVLAERHHRRGLCGCSKGCRTCGSAKRNLQEVAAFHDIVLFFGRT